MAPASSSLNPWASLQKTRAHLKQSEHVKGVMAIEEHLDRLDSYRSTTLKWRYPITTHLASPRLIAQIKRHRKGILVILGAHGFPPRKYLRPSIRYVNKHGYANGLRQPILSLAYIIDPFSCITPSIPSSLDPARDAIVAFLRTKGIKMQTEIVFLNQTFDPTLFLISSSAPEKEAFATALGQITRITMLRLGYWVLIDIQRLGLTDETAPPTIVVQVAPRTRVDWNELADELRSCLPQDIRSGIEVEFVVGDVPKQLVYPDTPRWASLTLDEEDKKHKEDS